MTRSPDRPGRPNRSARSSRAFATRPGTSEKIRSATVSLLRRSRCASCRSRPRARSGRSASSGNRSASVRARTVESTTALAREERGPGSKTDSSPNIWPGPRTDSRFSRPSAAAWVSLILPASTRNSRSLTSPSSNSTAPRGTVTRTIRLFSAARSSSLSHPNSPDSSSGEDAAATGWPGPWGPRSAGARPGAPGGGCCRTGRDAGGTARPGRADPAGGGVPCGGVPCGGVPCVAIPTAPSPSCPAGPSRRSVSPCGAVAGPSDACSTRAFVGRA